MKLAVRGYETQVKVFLILVVLFLVTANLVTVTSLLRSRGLLVEEAGARAITSAVSMARQVESEELVRDLLGEKPGAAARASDRLARLGRIHGSIVAEIVDGEGRVRASSQSWRHGSVEPIESSLDPASLTLLRNGRPTVAGPRQGSDETTAWAPLASGGRPERVYVRAGFPPAATGTISRQIRILVWAQALGGIVVLVMVLLFSRFVLRPYRELREMAESLEEGPPPGQEAGDPAFLVASFRGVVDKMRSVEAELDRMRRGPSSAGGQEAFLEGLSSGVLIVDEGGRVAALNPAGESILGLQAARLLDRDYSEVLASSPELAGLIRESVEKGVGRSREMVTYRPAGGRTVHLGITVSTPPGGAGGALCLFSDLTEIRNVQERVLLKENLARLGELSAGIAHEFRNSLGTILGYARLASRGSGEAAEHADAIIREVRAMDRVVGEFLRYAGPARLQKGHVDLKEMVEEAGREAAHALSGPVDLVLEGEWPERIHADEALLRQAFHNLFRNAAEAAGAPVRITVTSRTRGGAVIVDVEDEGPGFPEEVLPRLFTPFVTTKDRGTGLGLALAQKVIVSHDGLIEAGNREEGGGRIRITLPLE